MYFNIESSVNWKSIELISKGWSSDKKYKITTFDEESLLLRVSDIEQYDAKKKEYEIITKYSKLGINMSMPKVFGTCNEGKNVYMILSWIEGNDLEEILQLSSYESSQVRISGDEIAVQYVKDNIPDEFWIANAVYVAQASLFSIKWAEKFGQEEIDGMVRRARTSFKNFEDFNIHIPKWYTNEYQMKYCTKPDSALYLY